MTAETQKQYRALAACLCLTISMGSGLLCEVRTKMLAGVLACLLDDDCQEFHLVSWGCRPICQELMTTASELSTASSTVFVSDVMTITMTHIDMVFLGCAAVFSLLSCTCGGVFCLLLGFSLLAVGIPRLYFMGAVLPPLRCTQPFCLLACCYVSVSVYVLRA